MNIPDLHSIEAVVAGGIAGVYEIVRFHRRIIHREKLNGHATTYTSIKQKYQHMP
jgi:hypothetical protein